MATSIEALRDRAKLLESELGNSPTAYAPKTAPTKTDLRKDSELATVNRQIEDLRSKNIRNKWYGGKEIPVEDSGQSGSLVMRGLDALQRPLNAVVGTGQYLLGKGSESSLTENINTAMKTGLTAGDVLKQYGAPRGVQVPLGFALDVMFDPVNWATAGTAALIPRVGTGLVKGATRSGVTGALEAAGTGLVSGLEKKASTALNLVPFAQKSEKYANLTRKLGEKAIAGGEKYDSLIGKDVYDKLGKGVFGMPAGTIGKTVEEAIRKTPTGDKIADFFKYSTRDAAEMANLKDKVTNLAKEKGVILTRNVEAANFESVDDFLAPDAKISLPNKMEEAIRGADGVLKEEFIGKAKVADSLDNAKRILEIAGEDYNLKNLINAYKVVPPGKTGFQWYDNAIERLKSTTVDDILHARLGKPENIVEAVQKEADDLVQKWNSYSKIQDIKPLEKILNAYQGFISAFKLAKVPMNASAHVVANIGNMVMGAMMGLPVYKPEYIRSVGKAALLVKGRLGAKGLRETFFNDLNSWVDFLDKNPNRFRQLTGMDPTEVVGKLSVEEKVMGVLGTSKDDVKKYLLDAWNRIDEAVEGTRGMDDIVDLDAAAKIKKADKSKALREGRKFKTASETLQEMTKEAPVRQSEMPGAWASTEVVPSQKIEAFKKWISESAENSPYNPVARAANMLVNSMPRWYEHIDQSWKIGTTDFLTRVGLTEPELIAISRSVPIGRGDILDPIIRGGKKYYPLTPLKASEVAMEAFMNYAAMPDFVKIMRAVPIVGAPFYSFPYAMAIKTGKTAINNPAIFNKIGFIMDEMNAGRSPQEKAALEEKYNQYLKAPTVVKLFGMWNTDVKNMVPYFTMNMFNPSERKYDDSFQGQMLKLSDKFPVLQDPVGQVMKDYFLQPWLLSGSAQAPQGQFGQPLYPSYDESGKKINAGVGTKLLYGGRSLAESFVPGSLSYLGLPLGLTRPSPEAVEFIPSYGIRNILNATQGRSSIGAESKEDAVRKTLRAVLGRTGIPAYNLDVTKTKTKTD